jgi:hypothetical protein
VPQGPPRLLSLVALCLLVAFAACGKVDLTRALDVTDVLTGYYDAGIKDGKNYLVPAINFHLHNRTAAAIGPVQVTVAFWKDGDDGEWDSVLVQGVTADGLAPDATTPPLLARNPAGYTLEGARADFFAHSLFRDVTAKLFASQSGSIVKIGEFKLDHRILPH